MEKEPDQYKKILCLSRAQDMYNGRLRIPVVSHDKKKSTIDITNLPANNDITLANTHDYDGSICGVYLAKRIDDRFNKYLGLSSPIDAGKNLLHLLNPNIDFVDEE